MKVPPLLSFELMNKTLIYYRWCTLHLWDEVSSPHKAECCVCGHKKRYEDGREGHAWTVSRDWYDGISAGGRGPNERNEYTVKCSDSMSVIVQVMGQ